MVVCDKMTNFAHMEKMNNTRQISDLSPETPSQNENIRFIYNDDELIVADSLRDIPDFRNFKIGYNVVFQCHLGEVQFDLGNETIRLHAGQVFISHSHITIGRIMISPDFEGSVICISDRLLKTIMQMQLSIWNRALYQRHYLIFNQEENSDSKSELGEMVIENFRRSTSPYKKDILVCLLRMIFLMICEHILQEEEKNTFTSKGDRMDIIFQHFLENISRRKVKKASVAEYASELCITPKYLSTICRKVSGKSPIEWISEYVIQDITVYLCTTNMSAKEIATKMGFPNSSFFGKYVREHLGMSPTAYRQAKRTNKQD